MLILLIIILSIIYSLLFGVEIALASSNKPRLELNGAKYKLVNKALSLFHRKQNPFFSSLFSFFTLLIYVVAFLLLFESVEWKLRFLLAFLSSIVFLFLTMDLALRRIFKYNPIASLRDFDNEVRIFQNALDFSKVKLKNCIIPRTEIVAIELDATVAELQALFVESHYSRILVYKENTDNIVGYVHSLDMFGKPADIKSLLNPLIIAPETMAANKLLKLFLQQQKGIALVVDEFGGTAGIITLEDIMEEIFGEIEDEHDEENEHIAKQIRSNEYLFSGRLEVKEVNEQFALKLPLSEDYITIAGLILSKNEVLPAKNDQVTIGKYRFTILRVTATRIELVKMKEEG